MFGDKILYQIGNADEDYFLFPKTENTIINVPALKTTYEQSNLFNGEARINVGQKNKKGAYNIVIEFLWDEMQDYNLDYLNKVFYTKPKIVFFYSKDKDNNPTFYYNYADVIKPPQQVIKVREELGTRYRVINVELKLVSPYFYKTDSSLKFYDNVSFMGAPYWGDGVTYWGGTSYWGQGAGVLYTLVSSLDLQTKLEYFDSKYPQYPLFYEERFYGQGLSIDPNNRILDYTLTSNSETFVGTEEIYTQTSADGYLYLINLPRLSQNQYISIRNTENNTGLRIDWLDSSSSPVNIIWNSLWQRLYDVTSGSVIEDTKYSTSIPVNTNTMLYFDPQLTINATITDKTELISLTKSTSSNYRVQIELLQTVH